MLPKKPLPDDEHLPSSDFHLHYRRLGAVLWEAGLGKPRQPQRSIRAKRQECGLQPLQRISLWHWRPLSADSQILRASPVSKFFRDAGEALWNRSELVPCRSSCLKALRHGIQSLALHTAHPFLPYPSLNRWLPANPQRNRNTAQRQKLNLSILSKRFRRFSVEGRPPTRH